MIPEAARLHAQLLQEPWGFTVEQVAGLTAWQVEHLYLRPAEERAERMGREMRGESAGVPVGLDLDDLESFVAGMEAAFPGQKSREQWEADWGALKLAEQAAKE